MVIGQVLSLPHDCGCVLYINFMSMNLGNTKYFVYLFNRQTEWECNSEMHTAKADDMNLSDTVALSPLQQNDYLLLAIKTYFLANVLMSQWIKKQFHLISGFQTKLHYMIISFPTRSSCHFCIKATSAALKVKSSNKSHGMTPGFVTGSVVTRNNNNGKVRNVAEQHTVAIRPQPFNHISFSSDRHGNLELWAFVCTLNDIKKPEISEVFIWHFSDTEPVESGTALTCCTGAGWACDIQKTEWRRRRWWWYLFGPTTK